VQQVVSLSFYRFDSVGAKVWAVVMMGLARGPMSRTTDIGFWKLCGSGTGEGFTPKPNFGVYAILATWPDEETAKRETACGVFARYAAKAIENWTVYMSPTSARGDWAGVQPFIPNDITNTGPIAALTRASVKPSMARHFWGRVPNISAVIGTDPSVLFKLGIGEKPLVHQVTFSIWPDAAAMNNFARTGPHAEAIKAVRTDGWFSEELYARFSLLSDRGTWGGVSPLHPKETI
jgi:spheroidene monooxygenase